MLLDNNIIALTPPKTGSVSLLHYLKSNGIAEIEPTNQLHTPHKHLLLSEVCKVYDIESLQNCNILITVRHPYTRLVSSYFHIQNIYHSFFKKRLFNNFTFFCDQLIDHRELLSTDEDTFYVEFFKNTNYKQYSFDQKHWGGLRFLFEQSKWEDVPDCVARPFKLEYNKHIQLQRYLGLDGTAYPRSNEGDYDISDVYNSHTVDLAQQIYYNDYIKYNYTLM